MFKMICLQPEIHLGKDQPRITKRGQQFTVKDKQVRDDLIRWKAAADISGSPLEKATKEADILSDELAKERAEKEALKKELEALKAGKEKTTAKKTTKKSSTKKTTKKTEKES